MRDDICLLLRKAGLRGTLRGFHYLSKAILFAIEDTTYLHHLTGRLYPDVAREFGVTSMQVERSMRTAIEMIWNHGNIGDIEELVGFQIRKKPYVGEFIDILAGYVSSLAND